jgi:hypothetical protein
MRVCGCCPTANISLWPLILVTAPSPAPVPLEAVMNSIRNGLGMRETEIVKEPTRLWNPHSYAIFARVHNTL